MPHGTTARLADPRRRLSSAAAPKASWAAAALSSPPGPARFGLELDDRSFLIARGRGLIGREPVAPNGEQPTHLVTLTDPARSVSRTHLEFGVGNAGLWVRDCHSTNGSDIEFDGQVTPLEPGLAVPVRPASTIHLGARRVRVCTVECRAVIDAVTVEWGAASRVGCRRERNQDTFGAHPPVFVVADGIGSHGAGDLASHQAVQALLALAAHQPVTAEMFNRALADARARIARIPAPEGDRPPGTTITGVIVTHFQGVPCWMVVNLGDSRTYRLDAAGLHQISVDHSIAQKLIDSGVVSQSAPRPMPLRNMLSRAVFGEIEHSPDVWRLPIEFGDRMLVCSDGLWSAVDDSTIRRVLQTMRDPQAAADALVDTATHAGGSDDVTVVVVDAAARRDSARQRDDNVGFPGDQRPRWRT
jgi:serine/threonine protein phosphatase PrpC